MLIHSLRPLFSQRFFALAFPTILCAGKTMCSAGKMALVFLTECDLVRNLVQFS